MEFTELLDQPFVSISPPISVDKWYAYEWMWNPFFTLGSQMSNSQGSSALYLHMHNPYTRFVTGPKSLWNWPFLHLRNLTKRVDDQPETVALSVHCWGSVHTGPTAFYRINNRSGMRHFFPSTWIHQREVCTWQEVMKVNVNRALNLYLCTTIVFIAVKFL